MINRQELVTRHNPHIGQFDPLTPLSVGNGEFAFTVDPTGLQTFPQIYLEGMPLCTMANWGWHSYTTPDHLVGKQLEPAKYNTFGRDVGYFSSDRDQKELFDWLRINPHRLHLGQIGLEMTLSDGSRVSASDVANIDQRLDLWQGIIISKFTVEDIPVLVKTACHPQQDLLLVSVESPLIDLGRLQIKVAFPYGSHQMHATDWEQPEKHRTNVLRHNHFTTEWVRTLDNDCYHTIIEFRQKTKYTLEDPHTFAFAALESGSVLQFSVLFTPQRERQSLPELDSSWDEVSKHWKGFWQNGGAIQLINSKDSRAHELERRIVLSQYVTAIQCSGVLPPQETGLTTNSWFGKAHLEMHWWHAAYFPFWGRPGMLENSLWWYDYVMPKGKQTAERQGYTGVRWPKMVGPTGVDSPSKVATLLIWQQPHPIAYAELMYESNPSREILERYQEIVMETAEFMASFAHYDSDSDQYILGPPLIPAQENHKATLSLNPTYEIEYWYFALQIAQAWRERLGLARDLKWDEIITKLAPAPVDQGVYLAHEKCPESFTHFNYDHPSMLCAYGVLPSERINPDLMRQTLETALASWEWERAWGWDFPVVAMTAARVGEPNLAVDALFIESVKNTWLANGHNYQRPNLPLYLPGNGALLLAVGMMAAGWKNCSAVHAPGFPQDGSWTVEVEGIKTYW